MENISTYNNADQQDDEMQLIPLVKLCYHQFITYWGWFALSTVVCVCLGWLYQQKQSRIFQRQAVMLIEDTNGSSSSNGFRSTSRRNSGMNTLLELNGVSVGDNLKNEIFILSSKRLMQRVIDKLHLEVDYTVKEKLHDITLYGKDLPFQVLSQKNFKGKGVQHLTIVKKDGNTVTLKNLRDQLGKELPDIDAKLGQMVNTPYGPLCIVRASGFGKWEDKEVEVNRLSPDMAAARFMGELSASEYDKETSLIVLSCNDANTERADAILATL